MKSTNSSSSRRLKGNVDSPGERTINVFLSSTSNDLETYRKLAAQQIRMLGFTEIVMKDWSVMSKSPIEVIEEKLSQSDTFIGIYAFRYGGKVPGTKTSYTEYEYELATKLRLPALIFLVNPNIEIWTPKHVDTGRDHARLQAFKARLKSNPRITWKEFSNETEFVSTLSAGLVDAIRRSSAYKAYTDEERTLFQMRRLVNEEFNVLRAQGDPATVQGAREWFIPPLASCNQGGKYIPRDRVRKDVADWYLNRKSAILFLTGPSGIGKTNFLAAEQMPSLASGDIGVEPHTALPSSRPAVLFFSLGRSASQTGLLDELAEHLRRFHCVTTASALEALIRDGRILLILDGLDEFVRVQGEENLKQLFDELQRTINPARSRVIISCRDHIYGRIHRRGLLPEGLIDCVKVPSLDEVAVREALASRLGKTSAGYFAVTSNPNLLEFARKPLLLELMCQLPQTSWRKLMDCRNVGRLYDLWFEEVVAASATPEEIVSGRLDNAWIVARTIAGLMLDVRLDFITETPPGEEGGVKRKELEPLAKRPFGVLVEHAAGEWSFVHDSFREFALAKAAAEELLCKNYKLLQETPSFDYVGAETYAILAGLIPEENLYARVEEALNTPPSAIKGWNNLVRNCFEAVGMIAQTVPERFVLRALDLLNARRSTAAGTARDPATPHTKYNIVRFLERVHPSAPQPYYESMMKRDWFQEHPREGVDFGVWAMRGFHRLIPEPGYSPPMEMRRSLARCKQRHTRAVSDCLLGLLEHHSADFRRGSQEDPLAINCTMALIRWLDSSHVKRIKLLLERPGMSPGMKGNLFHSFYLRNGRRLLQGCSDLFAEMDLCWVHIVRDKLPKDFRFIGVRFLRYDQSTFIGFDSSDFVDCRYE